jgi:hypothetical protein
MLEVGRPRFWQSLKQENLIPSVFGRVCRPKLRTVSVPLPVTTKTGSSATTALAAAHGTRSIDGPIAIRNAEFAAVRPAATCWGVNAAQKRNILLAQK